MISPTRLVAVGLGLGLACHGLFAACLDHQSVFHCSLPPGRAGGGLRFFPAGCLSAPRQRAGGRPAGPASHAFARTHSAGHSQSLLWGSIGLALCSISACSIIGVPCTARSPWDSSTLLPCLAASLPRLALRFCLSAWLLPCFAPLALRRGATHTRTPSHAWLGRTSGALGGPPRRPRGRSAPGPPQRLPSRNPPGGRGGQGAGGWGDGPRAGLSGLVGPVFAGRPAQPGARTPQWRRAVLVQTATHSLRIADERAGRTAARRFCWPHAEATPEVQSSSPAQPYGHWPTLGVRGPVPALLHHLSRARFAAPALRAACTPAASCLRLPCGGPKHSRSGARNSRFRGGGAPLL